MLNRTRSLKWWFFLMLSCYALAASAATREVGQVVFAKGVVTAQVSGEPVRLVGTGGKLFEGDVISTASRSFAVLKLIDGTQTTLRPDTVFKLEAHELKGNESSALVELFKGGVRTVSGQISKQNPGGSRIKAGVAALAVRGTDFEARLCAADCVEESRRTRAVAQERSAEVVARVVLLRGSATATGVDGRQRALALGSPLFSGETVETMSRTFAVLAFRDESRITLQPDTRFEIERYRYTPESPGEASMLVNLLKGGLRTLTGRIGRLNRDAVQLKTPASTIGIRGTGFDAVCQGDCLHEPGTGQPPTAEGDGMFLSVWDGEVVLRLATGEVVISQGRVVFVGNNETAPIPLARLPAAVADGLGPRPDRPESSDPTMQTPFASVAQTQPEFGLYVRVFDGWVVLTGALGGAVHLGSGETGFAGTTERQAVRLDESPNLVPTITPEVFDDPQVMDLFMLFDAPLQSDLGPVRETAFECVVR